MISVGVVTMTLALSDAEQAVLVRALNAAVSVGLPIAVADRSGRPEFFDHLARMPDCTVVAPRMPGLVPQIQAPFNVAAAFDTEFLLYTEPDKESFFLRGVKRLLARGACASGAGVILAARSDDSFRTFPAMQQVTEGFVNQLCGNLIGPAGDYSYGPFLMHRRLLPHIASLLPHLGWGWRFSTFRAAARYGCPIAHAIDDLPCPLDQRGDDEEDQAHRLRQLSQNLLGLID